MPWNLLLDIQSNPIGPIESHDQNTTKHNKHVSTSYGMYDTQGDYI